MYLIYFARTNTKVREEDLLRAQLTLQSGRVTRVLDLTSLSVELIRQPREKQKLLMFFRLLFFDILEYHY